MALGCKVHDGPREVFLEQTTHTFGIADVALAEDLTWIAGDRGE